MRLVKSISAVAIIVMMAGAAHASVRVGGWAFSANGQLARDYQYTGPCPVELKFDWGVLGTEPGTVTYTFSRNDGGHSSSPQSITLPAPNQSVPIIETWRLGANNATFASYSGWMQLDIQSPNPVSKRINFTIHCAGPTVRVGGWSLRANGEVAQGFQYTGPCPVSLKFGWGVLATAPTTATYTFTRNDGGHSSTSQSVDIPAANRSVPIYDDWHLGANTPQFANYSGWVQINIDSPNAVAQKIPFTIHCQ